MGWKRCGLASTKTASPNCLTFSIMTTVAASTTGSSSRCSTLDPSSACMGMNPLLLRDKHLLLRGKAMTTGLPGTMHRMWRLAAQPLRLEIPHLSRFDVEMPYPAQVKLAGQAHQQRCKAGLCRSHQL